MRVTFSPSGYAVEVPDELAAMAEQAGSPMMDAGELLHLAGALAAFDWRTEAIVVEIGAYVGQTTVFMARALELMGRRIPILSIDPFERTQPDSLNPQGIYAAYVAGVRAAGFEDVCLPLAAFSGHAAAVVPERIGVLILDGGHHYPVVRDDLERYAPKVVPEGLIFIDDYCEPYADVVRAVDEYFAPGGAFAVLHRSHFVVAKRVQ